MRCFMKKKLFFLLLFLFVPSFYVYASENDDVIIKNISIFEKSRDAIVADSSFDNQSVSFDFHFQYQTDFIKYKLIVENKSNESYQFFISDTEDDIFSYQYHYPDTIAAGSEEEVIVEVHYKDEISQSQLLSSGNSYVIHRDTNFELKPLSESDNNLDSNPLTFNTFFIIFIVFICIFLLFAYFFQKKNNRVLVLLLLVGVTYSLFQPLMALAEYEKSVTLYMNYDISIDPYTYSFQYSNYDESEVVNCSDKLNEKTVEDLYNSCVLSFCNVYFHHNDGIVELINDRMVAAMSDFYGFYTCQSAYSTCLSGEMEVEVLDCKTGKKKKKKLKDVNEDDLLLAWNFDDGCFEYVPVFFIKKLELADIHVLLTFDDGSTLDVVGVHRIFNLDQNFFGDCALDLETPIGMRTINQKGEIIRLVSKKTIYDQVVSCCVVTEKCFNFYANGILTSITLNNLYPISDMKFIKKKHDTFKFEDLDIEKGYYDKLRFSELSKTFLRNEADTKKFIYRYIDRMKEQNIIKKI